MALLNWMGEHPILTVVLVIISIASIIDTVRNVAAGIAYKRRRAAGRSNSAKEAK